MSGVTMKELGLERLTPEQRIDLALEIWESIGKGRVAPELSPAQRAELARRDSELDADPSSALTWEQIRKFVEGKR